MQFKNKNPAAAPAAMAGRQAPYTVREEHLCAIFRLSKDELRERRVHFLAQGVHWDYVKKRVLLTEIGAAIIGGTLGEVLPAKSANSAPAADCDVPRAAVALLLEKNPPPVQFAGELIAWAMPPRNPRLLICYLPNTDPGNPLNLVSCFVRTNVNFLRGMTLPGPGRSVHQVDHARFELTGEPPRFRGRW